MSNKTIQRNRMLRYFVESALQIIEKEGLEGITIRKVADIAGYNSATLYNYFDSLNHLIYFTSISYLNEYIREIQTLGQEDNPVAQYIDIWNSFARNAFNQPDFFYIVFFSSLSIQYEEYYSLYYEVFPAEVTAYKQSVSRLLKEKNISDRSMILMKQCIANGDFTHDEGANTDQIVVLTFESLLRKVKNNLLDPEEAKKMFAGYLDHLFIKCRE